MHIGPKLCSLLVRPEEGDEGDGVSSDGSGQCVGLQELWHHLALPPDITVMLCGNGIQQHGTLALPSNILLVQYGFQVGKPMDVIRSNCWNTIPSSNIYTDINTFICWWSKNFIIYLFP